MENPDESYIGRVKKEYVELCTKMTNLTLFINTREYDSLDEAEKARLKYQKASMWMYATILKDRIDAYEK